MMSNHEIRSLTTPRVIALLRAVRKGKNKAQAKLDRAIEADIPEGDLDVLREEAALATKYFKRVKLVADARENLVKK